MRTEAAIKNAAVAAAARKNGQRSKPYPKADSLSRANLKLRLGELLLFGDKQQMNFWRQFESKLRRFCELKLHGRIG